MSQDANLGAVMMDVVYVLVDSIHIDGESQAEC